MKHFNLINDFLKDFVNECRDKNILMLASSSCFFFFLCLIPSTLLLLSFSTFAFEQIVPSQAFTFLTYVESVVPNEILPTFKLLFKYSKVILSNNKEQNFMHYSILIISSLGFFGSIWKSVDIITGIKKHGTLLRTLYSFLSIAISFSFFMIIAFLPILSKMFSMVLASENLKFFHFLRSAGETYAQYEHLSMNFISTLLLFLFFIFFFKFLLKASTNLKSTVVGSAFFTILIIISKTLFLSYISLAKQSLLLNYGSLYSILIFVMWIFTVITALYASIIFTYALSRHRYDLGLGKFFEKY